MSESMSKKSLKEKKARLAVVGYKIDFSGQVHGQHQRSQ